MWPEYVEEQDFINHVKLLNKLLHKNLPEDEYICPLCLESGKPMTKEHVPQRAIGGHKLLDTCKDCNNTAGYLIDDALIRGLYHLIESKEQVCLKEKSMIIQRNDGKLNIILKPGDNNKEAKLCIDGKLNKDEIVTSAISDISVGDIINIECKLKPIDENAFSAAIIKNAYLALFSRFGYTFLLDSHYDVIRHHISDCNNNPIPCLFCIRKSNTEPGIYKCETNYNKKEIRFFMIIIPVSLDNDNTVRRLYVALPTPKTSIKVLSSFLSTIKAEDRLKLKPTSTQDLFDKKMIIDNLRWAFYRKY